MRAQQGIRSYWNRYTGRGALLAVLISTLAGFGAQAQMDRIGAKRETAPTGGEAPANRAVKEGLAIEFIVRPANAAIQSGAVMQGRPASIRFSIAKAANADPLSGLYPAVWMDRRKGDSGNLSDLSCVDKIKTYLKGNAGFRPTHDLNSWYVVAMNQNATISVIDPLVDYGGQRLIAMIFLNSPGEDWLLSEDGRRLFVSLPNTDQIAVVDTVAWEVSKYLTPGRRPVRLAVQPDRKYLWVGIDTWNADKGKGGGVSVIDADTLKIVAKIDTGGGHHEIAFSDDDRYAFIGNDADGTVSVIDIRTLTKIKDIKTGSHVSDLVYSSQSQALYVIDRVDGTIMAVDGRNHEVSARIEVAPGLASIRFTPNGKWALVTNSKANKLYVLDPSLNRIAHTLDVAAAPKQISFSDDYAYIRPEGSEMVSMVDMSKFGRPDTVPVVRIPGGRLAPDKGATTAGAGAIVPTPEPGSVLIANPADRTIYYYMEGMGAPAASFDNERLQPRAVLAVDKGLRETLPGSYETSISFPDAGTYDVAFLLDTPRIYHCFRFTVVPDPALEAKSKDALTVRLLNEKQVFSVAGKSPITVRLFDRKTRKARDGVQDLRALVVLAPGTWQRRVMTKPLGDGVYQVPFSPPRPGVYYIYFSSPSLDLWVNDFPYQVLHVRNRIPDQPGGKG